MKTSLPVRAASLFLLAALLVASSSVSAQDPTPRKAPPPADDVVDPKAGPATKIDPKAAPATKTAEPKSVDGNPLHMLMADLIFYKAEKKGEFDVNLKVRPFSFEFPADKLEVGWLEEIRKNSEEEVNRPSGRKRVVEKVKFVQFTLSEDSTRVVGALVFFDGKEDGKAMVDAATRLTFSPAVWTASFSQSKAKSMRQKLHDTLGKPDRGEVHERAILLVEDTLLKIKR